MLTLYVQRVNEFFGIGSACHGGLKRELGAVFKTKSGTAPATVTVEPNSTQPLFPRPCKGEGGGKAECGDDTEVRRPAGFSHPCQNAGRIPARTSVAVTIEALLLADLPERVPVSCIPTTSSGKDVTWPRLRARPSGGSA